MKTKNFGVLYIKYGEGKNNGYGVDYDELLNKSIKSIEKFGYQYHVHEENEEPSLLCKGKMYELSPFQNTLYLDCDTIVLRDLQLDEFYNQPNALGFCVEEASYLRRWYPSIPEYACEFNTGVIAFSATPQNEKLFSVYKDLCLNCTPNFGNDQPFFSLAVHSENCNYRILPNGYNYRRYRDEDSIFGPVYILHTTKILDDEKLNRLSRMHYGFYNV